MRALHAIVGLLLGLLLLPVCLLETRLLLNLLHVVADGTRDRFLPLPAVALLAGFGVWLVLYLIAPRPVRSYVLAHELTHAVWGLIMGARVSKLKVGREGGSVTLSRTNIWITLAPYFFPFYTMIVVLVYSLASLFVDLTRFEPWWIGLIGGTWGFHVTFTVSSLLQRQPDIQQYGYILSYALIYILNLSFICLGVLMVTPAGVEHIVLEGVAAFVWSKDLLSGVLGSANLWLRPQ